MSDFFPDMNPTQSEAITQWVHQTFEPIDPDLQWILDETRAHGFPEIQLRPMDGRFLEILTRMVHAKTVLEIGTLTGYSGVCLLRGMDRQGTLYAIEKNPEHAQLARKHFNQLGYESQVKLIIQPALEALHSWQDPPLFDLVFIDADKHGYPEYWRWCADRIRPGGLLVADNTLAFGQLANTEFHSKKEEALVHGLQEFNRCVAGSNHYRSVLVPTSSGFTVALKLPTKAD